jgi:hypothetical protein
MIGGFAVHFFEDFPLPHSPDLLPWELNRGGADSTLRHCEDLTEQRLLQLHHLSPSLPFSWCSSSSPMGTVATTHALFVLFLAEALLGLEFLEFSCGHGDAGGCAAVELPVGSKMGHGGHHVMIHIWQRQWTHLAFARSGLLQGTLFVSLPITLATSQLHTGHAQIYAPSWLLLAPFLVFMIFHLPSLLISSCSRLSTSVP